MVGFENQKAELDAIGAKVVAISADDEEKAGEVAAEVSFDVAHGATREEGAAVGAWWMEARGAIQPVELIVGADGKIVASSYAAGPLGRMDAADVVKLIKFYEARDR